MQNFSDTSKAKMQLIWRADTELGEGIDNTISWFIV